MTTFDIQHTVQNGIERVTYIPKQKRFQTPILMQHGMWHGAWCWQHWQETFAQLGWESHAISLPGHAGSPTQRPVYFCTMGYYLRFLKAEIDRLPQKPILMGHSMGGGLTQWYLKYVGDDLPAVVLVAPWSSHSNFGHGTFMQWVRLDPFGVLLASLTASANFYIRSPKQAAAKLLSPTSIYTPDELHARLGPESGWVMLQHNPPFWRPTEHVKTPMLWLAGEKDALIQLDAERESAAHYKADFVVIPNAAHNIMLEDNYREIAQDVHRWLENRCQ